MKHKLSFLLSSLAFSSAVWAAPTPVNVYTYDSFAAKWGAGPQLKQLFEQHSPQCQINYVAFDSSGLLFNRVRLDGKKNQSRYCVRFR